MNLFLFGALCGLITGIMSITLIAAIHVHEVEKENDYLKKQLNEQIETIKDNEYKYFDVDPIDSIVCLKNFHMKGE